MRSLAILYEGADNANSGGLHEALQFVEGVFAAKIAGGVRNGD